MNFYSRDAINSLYTEEARTSKGLIRKDTVHPTIFTKMLGSITNQNEYRICALLVLCRVL